MVKNVILNRTNSHDFNSWRDIFKRTSQIDIASHIDPQCMSILPVEEGATKFGCQIVTRFAYVDRFCLFGIEGFWNHRLVPTHRTRITDANSTITTVHRTTTEPVEIRITEETLWTFFEGNHLRW